MTTVFKALSGNLSIHADKITSRADGTTVIEVPADSKIGIFSGKLTTNRDGLATLSGKIKVIVYEGKMQIAQIASVDEAVVEMRTGIKKSSGKFSPAKR